MKKFAYLAIIISLSAHLVVLLALNFWPVFPPEEKQHYEEMVLQLEMIELPDIEEVEMVSGESVKNLTANQEGARNDEQQSYSARSESKMAASIEEELRALEQSVRDGLEEERKANAPEPTPQEKSEKPAELDDYSYYKDHKTSYAGKVMVSYKLSGRNPRLLHNPGYKCQASGQVTIAIKVDGNGMIESLEVDPVQTTTSNVCLLEEALQSAGKSSFNKGASKIQEGSITYLFVGQ
jgi:outer membrane biosynthesis protein TonB